MAKKFVAPFGRRIARRVYEHRPRSGSPTQVTVDIGTPAPVRGSDWGCRVRIRGLSGRVDQTIFGIDSMQALELALMYSGSALTSSREFLSGRLRLWDAPARNLFEVALPLPLHSLQSGLEQLRVGMARLKRGKRVPIEWMARVETSLRSIAADLRRRRA